MTDHWLDDPSPYLDRDAPRCRRHPHELGTNCRLCRSEAIADPDAEPENTPTLCRAGAPPVPEELADVIPLDSRRPA